MATSGSIDFSLTRNELIYAAMRKLGVMAAGETPSAQEVSDAAQALNVMIKAWHSQGYNLWRYKEATLFIPTATASFSLGGSATTHATNSFTQTTLGAAAATSATSITVASISGISNGDYIGVTTDSDTIHWTTVNGAPSGTTVTLTVGMSAAASSGNRVFAYTSKIKRPLRITSARRYNWEAETDIAMEQLEREVYFRVVNKGSESVPTSFYYDPQLDSGVLYIWPTASTVDDVVKFTYMYPLEDFDALTDTPHLPQEWYEAIIYNLAARIAPEYGLSLDERRELKAEAAAVLETAIGFDHEDGAISFVPDMRGY